MSTEPYYCEVCGQEGHSGWNHPQFTLVVSHPDESGRVMVTSPDFPGIEGIGYPVSEAVDFFMQEIERARKGKHDE